MKAYPCKHGAHATLPPRPPRAPPATPAAAERVQRGQAAIGRFDAQHYGLAGATHAGKVFVHSPHDPAGQQMALLNINKQITALVAGEARHVAM